MCRDAEQLAAVGKRCAALLVDEAHDLPIFASKEISDGHERHGFYLLVACDRHQRLRLAGADARIVEGVDFSLRSKRLRQIYRNSAPVYIASLGLMFRWFATDGPKVVPTKDELQDCFGFDVTTLPRNGHTCSMMGDAHPANSWCHTVATFPNAESAYLALDRERMGYDDVLWVRFSEEDPEFNYEKLRAFTYHNCRSHDAHKLCDKYVKGQEYAIVVIEGFPSFMDRYETGEDGAVTEPKMWSFRREVYLCASRATCFLYFVFNPRNTSPEITRMRHEISTMVSTVSMPSNRQGGGSKRWSFVIRETPDKRNLEVFNDVATVNVEGEATFKEAGRDIVVVPHSIEEIASKDQSPVKLPDKVTEKTLTVSEAKAAVEGLKTPSPVKSHSLIRLAQPIIVKDLASALNLKPFQLIADLMEINIFASISQRLDLQCVEKLCSRHGVTFEELNASDAPPIPAAGKSQSSESPNVPSSGKTPAPVLDLISNPEPAESKGEMEQDFGFRHKIVVFGPTSVIDLARMLGIRHKDVMVEATRLGVYVRGQSMLSVEDIRRIAAKHGFAVDFTPER